jgi:hypothetical protein
VVLCLGRDAAGGDLSHHQRRVGASLSRSSGPSPGAPSGATLVAASSSSPPDQGESS